MTRTAKKFVIGVFLALFVFQALTPTNAATKLSVKAGNACPTVGKTVTIAKTTLICTKKSNKLIWATKPTVSVIKYAQLTYGSDLHGNVSGKSEAMWPSSPILSSTASK